MYFDDEYRQAESFHRSFDDDYRLVKSCTDLAENINPKDAVGTFYKPDQLNSEPAERSPVKLPNAKLSQPPRDYNLCEQTDLGHSEEKTATGTTIRKKRLTNISLSA